MPVSSIASSSSPVAAAARPAPHPGANARTAAPQGPRVRVAHGNFADYLERFTEATPLPASNDYAVPTDAQRQAFVQAWDAVRAGDLHDAARLADPLGYNVVRYR